MAGLRLVAIGKCREQEINALCAEYLKRLGGDLTVDELDTRKLSSAAEESAAILKTLKPSDFLVALDERGHEYASVDFAKKMAVWREQSSSIVFAIGGADGHTDALRKRANALLSLGKATWPHMMVRVMLLEQIYRAQQINAGHPYHRG